MADAKKITETVVKGITLTLTPEEAEIVLTLTGNLQGDRVSSPRKFADKVYYALNAAGVKPTFQAHLSGSLRLTNSPKISSYPAF
ncbi:MULTISPECIES: hypothetical protein [Streptomyces]|uniref:Uncharacterized protein n=2 Tax=Streptomyces TaxID=1883 RepID=A0ABV9IS95_9ACTN